MFTNSFKHWIQIWIHPRKTIRIIINSNHEAEMFLLIFFGGFSYSLNKAYFNAVGNNLSFLNIIISDLVWGPLSALFFVYIGGFMVKKIGLLFGGKSSYQNICSVIAWSAVPAIFILFLWPFRFIILGKTAFLTGPFYYSKGILILFVDILCVIMSIWVYIILIAGLSEVEEYSVWKVFLNLIISFIILVSTSIIIYLGFAKIFSFH